MVDEADVGAERSAAPIEEQMRAVLRFQRPGAAVLVALRSGRRVVQQRKVNAVADRRPDARAQPWKMPHQADQMSQPIAGQ